MKEPANNAAKTDATPKPERRKPTKRPPSLRFSPTAWAKLLFLRDLGETEVGGFGISSSDDLLYVADLRLIRQETTTVSVKFDDASVAEFFDEMVDAGLRPEQFARLWIHTHPGNSAHPSSVDERTFTRVFGRADWAMMFILARGGESYARLRFNVGPGGSAVIPVDVDYGEPFAGSDFATWAGEYERHVMPCPLMNALRPAGDFPKDSNRRVADVEDFQSDDYWSERFDGFGLRDDELFPW